MNNIEGAAHEAVEAVRKRDARVRRAFLGLGLFIAILLGVSTAIGFEQRATLNDQSEELARKSAEIALDTRAEAKQSQALVRELRAKFRSAGRENGRHHRRTLRFLKRIAERAGVSVSGLSDAPGGGGGGGGGKGP